LSRSRPVLWLLAGLAAVVCAEPVNADIAVLANGQTLKVSSWRFDGDEVTMVLDGGGELTTPGAHLLAFVPDEVEKETGAPTAEVIALDLPALIGASAKRYGLDPKLVRAVVSVESAFQPTAVSRKGARGLMQLMPTTAAALGVRDAFDPAANLDAGSRYLAELIQSYGGDLKRALAAYNAGSGAVSRYGGVPPYRETRDYVDKVLKRYKLGI
jgi:hypothetical protein